MAEKPERSPDFVQRYANRVSFELGPTDLKILFGTSEKSGTPIDHTAIIVAWAEAKLLLYYLTGNLTIYETYEGKIRIPRGALPPPPQPPSEERLREVPASQDVYVALSKLYEELLAEQT